MKPFNDCWDAGIHESMSRYASTFLWRYVKRNSVQNTAEETIANLTRLSERDLRILADIRLLLCDELKVFVTETAPQIVRRLSKESITEDIISRTPKGRIDWPKTVRMRAVHSGDNSLFAVTRRTQVFDLPENRLFHTILRHIHTKAVHLSGYDFGVLPWYAGFSEHERWGHDVAVVAAQAYNVLRNPYVSRIGRLREVNEKVIEETAKVRTPLYRELAEFAQVFVLELRDPLAFLEKNLGSNILEPLDWDTLYEIVVLFRTIQTAINNGWQEVKTGLIGGHSEHVCVLRRHGAILTIYYQVLPDELSEKSSYGSLLEEHGFRRSLRRPDIILKLEAGEITSYVIMEVKRSADKRYLADSAYKLLGYLKDFEQVKRCNRRLRGLLVAWKGIPYSDYESHREISFLTWDTLSRSVERLLASASLETIA